jgi:hypothetical protein
VQFFVIETNLTERGEGEREREREREGTEEKGNRKRRYILRGNRIIITLKALS